MTKGFMDVRNFSGQPLFAQITKMKCLVYTIPEWRYRKDEPDNGMRLDDAIGFRKKQGDGKELVHRVGQVEYMGPRMRNCNLFLAGRNFFQKRCNVPINLVKKVFIGTFSKNFV